MTRETFAEIVSILEATHRMGFSEEERDVWWALIRGLPDDAAKAATLEVCRRSPYPPKPAHIVNAVLGELPDAHDLLDEDAELAIRHMEAHLSDWQLVDLGPELNATVRIMGGPDAVMAQMMRPEDWVFRRQEARRIYKAYRRRLVGEEEGRPAYPRSLMESLNADRTAWRGAMSQEEWRASLLPETRPFLPVGTALAERKREKATDTLMLLGGEGEIT